MTKNEKILLGAGLLIGGYLLLRNNLMIEKTNSSEVLKKWKEHFDNKHLDQIVNTYSPKAILVSTFGDILEGRDAIREYFKGLFKKDNLGVTFTDEPLVTTIDGTIMFTGNYVFTYTENGKKKDINARYSILTKDGMITKQHSSESPK